jgi:hypothetical protein
MKPWTILVALAAIAPAWAQIPSILPEACNAMEPAGRRLECLRAASGIGHGAAPLSSQGSAMPQPMHAPGSPRNAVSRSGSGAAGGKTCHVGPRGGTYTITASGRKNYSGC